MIVFETPGATLSSFNLERDGLGRDWRGQPSLRIGVSGGPAADAQGQVIEVGAEQFTLADDATTYVELGPAGLVANTVGFTPGRFSLWVFVTSEGHITRVRDCRGLPWLVE